MQIFVSVPSGRTITLDVEKEDSVSILRNKIEAKEGIAADLQRLVFSGVQLEDSKTLNECNVGKEDTIIAVLRLLGGRGHGLVETTIGLEQLQDAHCCSDGAAAGSNPSTRSSEDDDATKFLDEDILADLPDSLFSFATAPAMGGLPSLSMSRQVSLQWDHNDTAFWATIEAQDSGASTQCSSPSQEAQVAQVEPTEVMQAESKPEPVPSKAKAPAQSRTARAAAKATAIVKPVTNPNLIQKSHKGLSYNLDEVDEKLRKRLLKNRQSAERSRQRKNAERKTLEEENAALRQELERYRSLLQQHGIAH